MKNVTLVALASVVMVAGPAVAGGPQGQGGHHGSGGHQGHGPRLRTSLPSRVFPHQAPGHDHGHKGRFGGVPVVGYGFLYDGPAYLPAPTSYSPSYVPPVSYTPPAMQTVIELSSGRYVLEGNGVTVPYRWVWVPNAPSEAPAVPTVSAPVPAASPPAPVPSLEYYRWTDADGVTHLTDSIDRVPLQYRAKATKSRT